MARRELPREDLIRDAVALVDRIEFTSPDQPPVVVGFRQDGSVSFYFGAEPVYQFNAARALRRAHSDGIVKAENGRLVRLKKQRRTGQVQLVRHELDDAQQCEFLESALARLRQLRAQLDAGDLQVARQVSTADADVLSRVGDWLARLPEVLVVAEGV